MSILVLSVVVAPDGISLLITFICTILTEVLPVLETERVTCPAVWPKVALLMSTSSVAGQCGSVGTIGITTSTPISAIIVIIQAVVHLTLLLLEF